MRTNKCKKPTKSDIAASCFVSRHVEESGECSWNSQNDSGSGYLKALESSLS